MVAIFLARWVKILYTSTVQLYIYKTNKVTLITSECVLSLTKISQRDPTFAFSRNQYCTVSKPYPSVLAQSPQF